MRRAAPKSFAYANHRAKSHSRPLISIPSTFRPPLLDLLVAQLQRAAKATIKSIVRSLVLNDAYIHSTHGTEAELAQSFPNATRPCRMIRLIYSCTLRYQRNLKLSTSPLTSAGHTRSPSPMAWNGSLVHENGFGASHSPFVLFRSQVDAPTLSLT
jgi:hypothetical protein